MAKGPRGRHTVGVRYMLEMLEERLDLSNSTAEDGEPEIGRAHV